MKLVEIIDKSQDIYRDKFINGKWWREVKETDLSLTNEEPKLSLSVDECKKIVKCEAPDAVVIRILEFIKENSWWKVLK